MLWKGFQRPKRLEFERETLTDRFGRFSLSDIPAGARVLRVQPPDGPLFEHAITVPAASYDIPVPEGSTAGNRGGRAARGSPAEG